MKNCIETANEVISAMLGDISCSHARQLLQNGYSHISPVKFDAFEAGICLSSHANKPPSIKVEFLEFECVTDQHYGLSK